MPKSKASTMPDDNAPTPQRMRRSAFVSAPAISTDDNPARAGQRSYRSLSTIERMLRDGAIAPRHAEAADRLRDDCELGIHGARNAPSGSTATTGWHYAQARLAAVRRYKLAVTALGPLAEYVLPIAVADLTLSRLAHKLRQNRQETTGCVKLGLNVLAEHYRLAR
jgi:hypothetical protein